MATVLLTDKGGPPIEEQKKCIFPFTYKGQTYNQCTRDNALSKGRAWCAIKVDPQGVVIDANRADCDQGCPGTGKTKYCTRARLSHAYIIFSSVSVGFYLGAKHEL